MTILTAELRGMSIEATAIVEAYPFLRHSVKKMDKPSILFLGMLLYTGHVVNARGIKSFKCSVTSFALYWSTRLSFNGSFSVECLMFPTGSGWRDTSIYMCVYWSINWVGMNTSCIVLMHTLVECDSLLLYWTARVSCGRGCPMEPRLLQTGPAKPTSCGVITAVVDNNTYIGCELNVKFPQLNALSIHAQIS